jgi:hypothetical protein
MARVFQRRRGTTTGLTATDCSPVLDWPRSAKQADRVCLVLRTCFEMLAELSRELPVAGHSSRAMLVREGQLLHCESKGTHAPFLAQLNKVAARLWTLLAPQLNVDVTAVGRQHHLASGGRLHNVPWLKRRQ